MNNFLRQFGSFKKNQNGLNEYVDYLGAKYTQDPKTGMWKTNGRSLNEQMLFEEAMRSQGGYGGEEGSGGRSQASRAQPVYTLGFAASANQTTPLADPFAILTPTTGAQTDSATRYATINHTAIVPIKFKLTAKTVDPDMTAATLKLRVGITDQVTFNIFSEAVNAESTTFNVSVNETRTFVLRYNGTWNVGGMAIASSFTVDIINGQLGTTIDSLSIIDTP